MSSHVVVVQLVPLFTSLDFFFFNLFGLYLFQFGVLQGELGRVLSVFLFRRDRDRTVVVLVQNLPAEKNHKYINPRLLLR